MADAFRKLRGISDKQLGGILGNHSQNIQGMAAWVAQALGTQARFNKRVSVLLALLVLWLLVLTIQGVM